MQDRGCLQVAMDPGSGTLSGLRRLTLLLHLLTVAGAAPRPDCVTSNGTDVRGERAVLSGGNCTNLTESQHSNLSQNNMTGASLNEDPSHRTVEPGVSAVQIDDQVKPLSASEPEVQQPGRGISHPVRQSAKQKRDLGVLGQALAIGMIIIIIVLGSGITLGYIYKRGRDLKEKQEQRACEQEIQRIMLPLSAFSNPSCELDDEITAVMVTPQTQAGDSERDAPLAAGTPGA